MEATRGSGQNSTKKVAFVHHKGGTGKTTACINIAGWLSKSNKRVLIIDLDPQGNATSGLGIDRDTVDGSIYDVLLGIVKLESIILTTSSGIHLVPSSLDLKGLEVHTSRKSGFYNGSPSSSSPSGVQFFNIIIYGIIFIS